jgi:peptidoglycan/xylan/chitin deacetylase (PgdA/CDA1 family)
MILSALYRLAGSALSPSGRGARLSILIHHRVLAAPDALMPGEPSVAMFDARMRLLKQAFNVLPLADAVRRLREGTLPARAACITFDDGYADNLTLAQPVLKKHGLHATFFIATSYLNGGRMFNDTVIEAVRRTRLTSLDASDLGLGVLNLSDIPARRQAIGRILPKVKYLPLDEREASVARLAARLTDEPLPDDLMMSTDQLIELHRSGMEIGGHTARHPILAKLDMRAAADEIEAGKRWLESTLSARLRVFAYPNGRPGTDYLPEQARLPRELGFEAALSTHQGVAIAASDLFQLPRYSPWAPQPYRYIPMLLGNLRHAVITP